MSFVACRSYFLPAKGEHVLKTCELLEHPDWRNRFGKHDLHDIVAFVTSLQRECPIAFEKYDERICERLSQLAEVRYEIDDSQYNARSRDTYIVFYKELPSPQHEYILYHELVHFLQQPGSEFEKVPPRIMDAVRERVRDGEEIEPLLFEEAYAQYMASMLHGFPSEKTFERDRQPRRYWMNDCYRGIVGYMDEIRGVIGRDVMLAMFLDDAEYERVVERYDDMAAAQGTRSFADVYVDCCRVKNL